MTPEDRYVVKQVKRALSAHNFWNGSLSEAPRWVFLPALTLRSVVAAVLSQLDANSMGFPVHRRLSIIEADTTRPAARPATLERNQMGVTVTVDSDDARVEWEIALISTQAEAISPAISLPANTGPQS
jgi:hypothetical protein